MDANNQHVSPGSTTPAAPAGNSHSRPLLIALGVMSVAVAALAAALVSSRGDSTPSAATAEAPAITAPVTTAAAVNPRPATAPAPVKQQVTRQPVVQQAQGRAYDEPRADTRTLGAAPASACGNCGVVEAVSTVQRQEQVNGIAGTPVTVGTVAGGVIGGLLGNQVGGGSGRTAATVLGAAGGAYAGNTIEKNMKKYTAYQMRVRMSDGTVRTVEQRSAVAAGSRVVVEGGGLRVTG